MSTGACERCGAAVESRLEVSEKPAVLLITPRYCDNCIKLVEGRDSR